MRLALSALIAALIPLPALAQKADGPPLRQVVFGDIVTLPPAFASARGAEADHLRQQGAGFLAEYFPRGSTGADWTRLTTITGNQGLARGQNGRQIALATLDRLRALYGEACVGALDHQDLTAPAVAGTRATAATWVSCSHVGATGQSEDVVALILVTETNVLSVQLATRGAARPQAVPRDPADWAVRLGHLAQARVCTPPPGEAAPYPSCN